MIIPFSSLCNDLSVQYVLPLKKKKPKGMKGTACLISKTFAMAGVTEWIEH